MTNKSADTEGSWLGIVFTTEEKKNEHKRARKLAKQDDRTQKQCNFL